MHFAKPAILLSLLFTLAAAIPAPEAEAYPDAYSNDGDLLEKRGFGCPFDEMKCHRHVRELEWKYSFLCFMSLLGTDEHRCCIFAFSFSFTSIFTSSFALLHSCSSPLLIF